LVKIRTDYGQDPQTQAWFSPQQRAWGLTPHQKITPGLAAKLCFTAVATSSYEPAATVVAQWGVPVDDAVIHQQVQRAGERADQQAQARVAAPSAHRRAGHHDGRLEAAASRRRLGTPTGGPRRRPRGMAGMQKRGDLSDGAGREQKRPGPAPPTGNKKWLAMLAERRKRSCLGKACWQN